MAGSNWSVSSSQSLGLDAAVQIRHNWRADKLGRAAPRIVPVPPLIARGVLWTVGTLANLAGRATLLSADKGNEYLAPAWTCRSDALTHDTGWQAEIGLDAGLRRAADWYREAGWL